MNGAILHAPEMLCHSPVLVQGLSRDGEPEQFCLPFPAPREWTQEPTGGDGPILEREFSSPAEEFASGGLSSGTVVLDTSTPMRPQVCSAYMVLYVGMCIWFCVFLCVFLCMYMCRLCVCNCVFTKVHLTKRIA